MVVVFLSVFISGSHSTVSNIDYRSNTKTPFAPWRCVFLRFVLHWLKTRGKRRRLTIGFIKNDVDRAASWVVLVIEEFSEGTMYLVSLEDYPLGIWFLTNWGIRMASL